jgi:hypothetical protein
MLRSALVFGFRSVKNLSRTISVSALTYKVRALFTVAVRSNGVHNRLRVY